MRLIIFAALVGIFAYVGWTVFSQYRASASTTLTGWHRWLYTAQGSATILWQKFVIGVSALAGVLSELADYFNEPSISNAIQSALKPSYVAAFVIFVGIVTIWARKRTL